MTGSLADTTSLAARRSTMGASTVLWAGRDGVTVGPDRWVALSGADSVEYNAALVHGSGEALDETLDDVLAAGVPAVVMVAAEAARDSSLLSSSHVGEPLYRGLGCRTLERWDQWSRPRWALARA